MILSSAGAMSSSNTSTHGQHGLQSTQSTAADVAARLLFRHNPSMSLDRILNSSFGEAARLTFLVSCVESVTCCATLSEAAVALAAEPRDHASA